MGRILLKDVLRMSKEGKTIAEDIQRERDRLITMVKSVPPSAYRSKSIDGTGGKVSISDLLAYQIGWGKCLIRWYETGIKGEMPEMPGEGFSQWDYVGIAKHFYQKYAFSSVDEQLVVFQEVVSRILAIVQAEQQTGNLDRVGVWPWCTLPSGKEWPLSKWVQVNTCAPYKRASALIRKRFLTKS